MRVSGMEGKIVDQAANTTLINESRLPFGLDESYRSDWMKEYARI